MTPLLSSSSAMARSSGRFIASGLSTRSPSLNLSTMNLLSPASWRSLILYSRSTESLPESILRPANLPEYGVSLVISRLRKVSVRAVNSVARNGWIEPRTRAEPYSSTLPSSSTCAVVAGSLDSPVTTPPRSCMRVPNCGVSERSANSTLAPTMRRRCTASGKAGGSPDRALGCGLGASSLTGLSVGWLRNTRCRLIDLSSKMMTLPNGFSATSSFTFRRFGPSLRSTLSDDNFFQPRKASPVSSSVIARSSTAKPPPNRSFMPDFACSNASLPRVDAAPERRLRRANWLT